MNVALAAPPRDPHLFCASIISDISPAMDHMRIEVTRWQPSDNIDGFNKSIQSIEQDIEQRLQKARDACNVGQAKSFISGGPILAEYYSLVQYVEDLMDAVIDKKPAFDSVPKVTPMMKNDVHNMFLKMYYFEQELLAATPDDKKDEFQKHYRRIDHAFTSAYYAYGIYTM